MRATTLGLTTFALLFGGVATMRGETPGVDATLPALNAEVLQADGSYASADLSQASNERPVVYLLIPAARWDRPVARFLKVLDDKLPGHSATAEIKAIWLTADAEATKEYLPRAGQSLQLRHSAMACVADEAGPAGWQPAADTQLTVVVANGGKVRATFSFGSVNETDVPQIGKAVEMALE